jgi:hypothetical protein
MSVSFYLEIDLIGLTPEVENISFEEIDLGSNLIERLDGRKHQLYVARTYGDESEPVGADGKKIYCWRGDQVNPLFTHLSINLRFTSRNNMPIFDWLKTLRKNYWCCRTYLASDLPSSETIESFFNIETIKHTGICESELLSRKSFVSRFDEKLLYFRTTPPNE